MPESEGIKAIALTGHSFIGAVVISCGLLPSCPAPSLHLSKTGFDARFSAVTQIGILYTGQLTSADTSLLGMIAHETPKRLILYESAIIV